MIRQSYLKRRRRAKTIRSSINAILKRTVFVFDGKHYHASSCPQHHDARLAITINIVKRQPVQNVSCSSRRDLFCDDGVVVIRSFLDDPQSYLSWKSVEYCLTRDDVFWELINKQGLKKNLPQYKPFWSPVPCQDKNTIYDHIQDKQSFVITGYSKTNRKAQDLCIEIERSLDVCADIHVYGGVTVI